MLMRFFGDFVNFTPVNSHFSSRRHKCKPLPWPQNTRFRFLILHLCSQTMGGFQSRTKRWQNTIFAFLDAQLDFLAIFSSLPYTRMKIRILSDSSGFVILSKFGNNVGIIVDSELFLLQKCSYFWSLKKAKICRKRVIFLDFADFGPKTAKMRLFDQFLTSLS